MGSGSCSARCLRRDRRGVGSHCPFARLRHGHYRAVVPEPRPGTDTSPAAEELQFAVWRRMTPMQKCAAFQQLQATAEAFATAGLKRRYPHASERELFLRRVALHLDRETMVRCYGWDPEAQ